MSSNLIKFKKQVTPGMIINNYPRDFDLLNCIALKARYELRDIDKHYKNILKKNFEIQQKKLSNKIKAEEEKEFEGWDNSNLLFELKMIEKSSNKVINFDDYLTPIEERQKKYFDYYKSLFVNMQKGGIKTYTNKQMQHFFRIQNAQKSIQKKTNKSKSVIFSNNYNKEYSKKQLPLLKSSSIIEEKNNHSLNENKPKKIPILKLSSFKIEEEQNFKKKLPLLKLFSLKENTSSKNINNDIKKINDNNINNNDKNSKDKSKNIINMKKKRIQRIKNLNRSCDDCLNNKFLFDKNLNPIIDTPDFKILSKRGNIQFNNSIWRTKDINDCVNPYNSNEVNNILNKLKQLRKKI